MDPLSPEFDYVKEVLIEKLLLDVEIEVYWRLLKLPKKSSPFLIDVYKQNQDGEFEIFDDSRHHPCCRCEKCPFYDTNFIENLWQRNLSPFHHWKIDPSESYIKKSSKEHFWFCQCIKCQSKMTCKIMKIAKIYARNGFDDTNFERIRLELCADSGNYEFDVENWKRNLIPWIVETIQKRWK